MSGVAGELLCPLLPRQGGGGCEDQREGAEQAHTWVPSPREQD